MATRALDIFRGQFLAEWMLCGALLLTLGGYLGYLRHLDYEEIDASERSRLASQALAMEKNLAPQLRSANRALQGLLVELASKKSDRVGSGPLNERVRLIADTLTGISTILVTDARGKVIHANVESLVGFDASRRDYFQRALKQRGRDTLFVTAPLYSALGATSISLVREISLPSGEFGGVVLAALDPVFFGDLLDSIRFSADTRAFLLHGDGKIFTSVPDVADLAGTDLAVPGSFFSIHQRSGKVANTFVGVAYLTGTARMVAFRTVQPSQLGMDKALVVTVSRDLSAVLANWRRQSTETAWLYAGMALFVSLVLCLSQWRRRVFQRKTTAGEHALRASDARLRALFEATSDALLISDARGTITMANQQVQGLLGYCMEELLGKSIEDLVPLRSRGKHSKMRSDFAANPGTRRMGTGMAVKAVRKDGSECNVEVSLSRIVTEEGVLFASALRDITSQIKAFEDIKNLAYFDQLTGLPNRVQLLDRLKQALAESTQRRTCGALLYIDLDHFKTLNETLGHDVGDLQLKEAATRLVDCVGEGDTVARIGGDEYAVIFADLGSCETEACAYADAATAKVLAILSQPYHLGGVSHSSTASIGVALFKGDSVCIDDLRRQSDIAMYRAKDAGRNTVRFFDATMETVVVNRVALERDLRNAVVAKQFVLHYQAQVMGLDRITGAEVLVRWLHPDRGTVPPADFIPLAEETGVILALGHWVLETACTQLGKWRHAPGMEHLTLAVNVSALQFAQVDFVEQVMSVIHQTGANPRRLKLELTESMLVGAVTDIAEKMHFLKGEGVGLSLDDFGTGYSSLSYLTRLPLEQLKIDKSFIPNILINPRSAAIARTIITLAESLGLTVIAEGVETDAEREFLACAGCHAYQGYFFSRPLPLEEFEAVVRNTSLRTTATAI